MQIVRISVVSRVRRPGISARALRAVVRHALRRERARTNAEVSIVLVADAAIRRLNRRFLAKDRTTDVLAFPIDGAGRGRLLGEVIISVDRARVQARRAGHPVRTEVALLAVHGVLHLMGYDDHTRLGAAAMMRRQCALLAEAGEQVAG